MAHACIGQLGCDDDANKDRDQRYEFQSSLPIREVNEVAEPPLLLQTINKHGKASEVQHTKIRTSENTHTQTHTHTQHEGHIH